MRVLFRNLIVFHAPLTDLIPEERWKPAGSVVADNLPERMFSVIRWGTFAPGMAEIKRGAVSVWIHDNPGTYGDIDAVLNLLYGRLNGVEQEMDEEGNEIVKLEWVNTSGDLYDPGYRTITKNVNFNIIGKGL